MYKNYCLNIDPCVFIFEGTNEFLFYNSELKTRVVINKSSKINELVYKLINIDNLYSICIKIEELKDPEIRDFIEKLKVNYICDIFGYNVKPISIPPTLKCHEEHRGSINEGNIMSLLNEITFYLNGNCKLNCPHCNTYYKQFLSCHKNDGYLEFQEVKSIIERVIKATPSLKLNFCGGNIELYPEIDKLFSYLEISQFKSNFHIYYLNLNSDILNKISSLNSILHVLIDFPLNRDFICKITKNLIPFKEKVIYNFIVTSERDIAELEQLLIANSIETYNMFPFYDGTNIDFFEKYVYITKKDLINEAPSKKDIYKRMLININNMGKLFVSSNKNIFANFNHKPIGKIEDSLDCIIKEEWEKGCSWKNIRNSEPCLGCIYQYLCSSPTDYEIAIGKHNLCHIN